MEDESAYAMITLGVLCRKKDTVKRVDKLIIPHILLDIDTSTDKCIEIISLICNQYGVRTIQAVDSSARYSETLEIARDWKPIFDHQIITYCQTTTVKTIRFEVWDDDLMQALLPRHPYLEILILDFDFNATPMCISVERSVYYSLGGLENFHIRQVNFNCNSLLQALLERNQKLHDQRKKAAIILLGIVRNRKKRRWFGLLEPTVIPKPLVGRDMIGLIARMVWNTPLDRVYLINQLESL